VTESRSTRARVTFVVHYLETQTTTNTARWACLALPRAEIRLRGLPGTLPEPVLESGHRPLLLFPSEAARDLRPEDGQGELPIQLIIPDGSWRQASRAVRRIPGLEEVERVKLPPGPPSRYRLRNEPRPECVSTFEAAARALGVLEGAELRAGLEADFERMVDRALFSRGQMTPAKFLATGSAPQDFNLVEYGRYNGGSAQTRPAIQTDPQGLR
jgi:DTW domain-containing protein YfiP